MHPGRGPGLTARRLGQRAGVETVTLSEEQMPSHSHTANGINASQFVSANTGDPTDAAPAGAAAGSAFQSGNTKPVTMNSAALPNAGGGQAHDNMQPFLAMNFIIALVGLYPSRS